MLVCLPVRMSVCHHTSGHIGDRVTNLGLGQAGVGDKRISVYVTLVWSSPRSFLGPYFFPLHSDRSLMNSLLIHSSFPGPSFFFFLIINASLVPRLLWILSSWLLSRLSCSHISTSSLQIPRLILLFLFIFLVFFVLSFLSSSSESSASIKNSSSPLTHLPYSLHLLRSHLTTL